MELWEVVSRISDPRIIQAQRHGLIVGLPREDSYNIAMKADLLCACAEARDLEFMFHEDLDFVPAGTSRVVVDQRWVMEFEWVEGFGAISVRLLE